MLAAEHNELVSFIWGIADECLRDVYRRGQYRDVILPMFVLSRFDALVGQWREEVGEQAIKAQLAECSGLPDEQCFVKLHALYPGYPIVNKTNYTLSVVVSETGRAYERLKSYIEGFDVGVVEIFHRFKFFEQMDYMQERGILYTVLLRFLDKRVRLTPPRLDAQGSVVRPGLDSHAMGTVFEELIRRFNEESNEEAGEHFTPRDVVELMADLALRPVMDQVGSANYSIYDGAAGTMGMCTVAEQRFKELGAQQDKQLGLHIYGQEINAETWAIAQADLLMRSDAGAGTQGNSGVSRYTRSEVGYGSTIAEDRFPHEKFNFMLSNPPYGKNWKIDYERLLQEGNGEVVDGRFVLQEFGGARPYRMLPSKSDGQLLFLLNNVSKMTIEPGIGSRIVEVHNGSSLFSGGAGSGESNARRYLVERDLVEAIIALPQGMFYNTGIATYIWVLNNRKPSHRRGRIQLLDLSNQAAPLRKNMGQKSCEFTIEQRAQIYRYYADCVDCQRDQSGEVVGLVLPNEEFLYWQLTVDRPLRWRGEVREALVEQAQRVLQGQEQLEALLGHAPSKGEQKSWQDAQMPALLAQLAQLARPEPYMDWNVCLSQLGGKRENKGFRKLLRDSGLEALLTEIDPSAAVVLEGQGQPLIDKALREQVQVPERYEGGIDGYMRQEVLRWHPDALEQPALREVGCAINFSQYFHHASGLRPVEAIVGELVEVNHEAERLMEEIKALLQ